MQVCIAPLRQSLRIALCSQSGGLTSEVSLVDFVKVYVVWLVCEQRQFETPLPYADSRSLRRLC